MLISAKKTAGNRRANTNSNVCGPVTSVSFYVFTSTVNHFLFNQMVFHLTGLPYAHPSTSLLPTHIQFCTQIPPPFFISGNTVDIQSDSRVTVLMFDNRHKINCYWRRVNVEEKVASSVKTGSGSFLRPICKQPGLSPAARHASHQTLLRDA